MPTAPYEFLEILVTLRCNVRCKNCIRLCSSEDVTGLNYSESDMSMAEVVRVVEQIEARRVAGQPVVENLLITGGEPTLHPEIDAIVELCEHRLYRTGIVQRLIVNSNQLREASPKVKPWVATFTQISEKAEVHEAVLLAPETPPAFSSCYHYRKWRVEASKQGYSLCCAAGGYLRLFSLDHLFVKDLPPSPQEFPTISQMNEVCKNCAFGGTPKKEKSVGRPVDAVYAAAAEMQREKRKVKP